MPPKIELSPLTDALAPGINCELSSTITIGKRLRVGLWPVRVLKQSRLRKTHGVAPDILGPVERAIGVTGRLGRLESIKIRDFWTDEARHFTPWLAREENLSLLGEAIEMNLELVGIEQPVGPFKADIVARDGDQLVIIENQLDATDHKHLGQLLVYAAGRNAQAVVWVAKQVTDEYRKVLDWLNEETGVSFYALEVELWRIGDSLPAPKFNIVCEPNELARPSLPRAQITDTKLLQLEFWKGFAEYVESQGSSFTVQKPKPQHWFDLRIGTSRAHVAVTASSKGRVGCELYIGHSQADALFDVLEKQREVIEGELGELEWQPLPDKKACRIARYRDADIDDQETWSDLYKWLLHEAESFRTAFADRVKSIELASVPLLGAPEPNAPQSLE